VQSCLLLLGNHDAPLRDHLRRCIEEQRAGGLALDALLSEELRADPLQLAKLHPSAVVLDLRSAELTAWLLLDRLKHCLATVHLPVLALVAPEDRRKALNMGAAAVALCGVSDIPSAELQRGLAALAAFAPEQPRRLLIVDEDAPNLDGLVSLLSGDGVEVRAVSSTADALLALGTESYQCVVLSLGLDGRLLELLDVPALMAPVVVHAPRVASEREAQIMSNTPAPHAVPDLRAAAARDVPVAAPACRGAHQRAAAAAAGGHAAARCPRRPPRADHR
jgi:DNA-binding response OmpR family regulator